MSEVFEDGLYADLRWELHDAGDAWDKVPRWRLIRRRRARRRYALAHYRFYGPGSAWESRLRVML